ncbi:MAG: sugar-binding domain-containing protein [Spirochaetia bacterium]|jgi:deoxyribonucleoside regulator
MKDKKTALLMEIARAYYLENRNQSEIAKSTGVTRSQISRYLKEVRERGIVQIRIVEPDRQFDSLRASLMRAFPHLKEVVIAPAFSENLENTREIVGRYAANFLRDAVRPGQKLVFGCGRTLRCVANALLPRRVAGLSVVQAMGNLGHDAHGIDYNEITRAAAHPFEARPYFISSPAILGVGSGSARDLIAANPTIRDVLAMARAGDVFVVGLGSLQSDQLYVRVGMIQQREIDELKGRAVGDICGRFFDEKGKERVSSFASRIIGIELEDLRRGRLSLGVACGNDKVAPIIGALKGKFINALASDENTIARVLQELSGSGGQGEGRDAAKKRVGLTRKPVLKRRKA